jgi:dihydroxy-acid dehydratase
MPEGGDLPIPAKLAKKGSHDIIRVTDGRMSGTAFGTVVLHVSPEAYVGGPLAAVKDGDIVDLDLARRHLSVDLTQNQIEKRLKDWKPPEPTYNYERGMLWMWYKYWEQADQGCVYPFS